MTDEAGPRTEHEAHYGNHEGYACGFSGPHCWTCSEPWPCRASRGIEAEAAIPDSRSTLTDPPLYYVLTRYRIDGNTVIASTKYDVTDQIKALFPAGSASDEGSLERDAWLNLSSERDMAEAYYETLETHLREHGCDHDFAEVANSDGRLRATPSPSEPETGK